MTLTWRPQTSRRTMRGLISNRVILLIGTSWASMTMMNSFLMKIWIYSSHHRNTWGLRTPCFSSWRGVEMSSRGMIRMWAGECSRFWTVSWRWMKGGSRCRFCMVLVVTMSRNTETLNEQWNRISTNGYVTCISRSSHTTWPTWGSAVAPNKSSWSDLMKVFRSWFDNMKLPRLWTRKHEIVGLHRWARQVSRELGHSGHSRIWVIAWKWKAHRRWADSLDDGSTVPTTLCIEWSKARSRRWSLLNSQEQGCHEMIGQLWNPWLSMIKRHFCKRKRQGLRKTSNMQTWS